VATSGKTDNTGFSQTCTDAENDGICDSNYTLASVHIDYLPLKVVDSSTPKLISSCTNILSPGVYKLTIDIIDYPNTCINIFSSDVVFDGARSYQLMDRILGTHTV